MRQSKTENSLIYLWLIFIQTHYGIYRVDNRHECHRERNRTKKEKNHNLIEEDDDMMKLKRMRQKGGQNKNAESKMKALPISLLSHVLGCWRSLFQQLKAGSRRWEFAR
jgi:hypothetical protein